MSKKKTVLQLVQFQYINTRIVSNLSVMAFGYQESAYFNMGIGPESRGFHALHYVLSGCGYFTINGITYTLKQGDLFLVPAGVEIHYYPEKDDPWDYIWISFSGFQAKYLLELANLTEQRPVYHPVSDLVKKRMEELLAISKDFAYAELSALAVLYHVLAALMDDQQISSPPKKNCREEYVYKAMEYIKEHYCESDLSLPEISRHMNLSLNYLSAVFKEQTGQTIIHYINSLRMAHACKLLESGQNTIQDIAFCSGFSDAHYFSKLFKKYIGTTPSGYCAYVKEEVF